MRQAASISCNAKIIIPFKIIADTKNWEELKGKPSLAILRQKFVTSPVVKQLPGVGHMTAETSTSLEGHSSRGISGSIRRKTGSVRPTSSSLFSLCFLRSVCELFAISFIEILITVC